MSQLLHQVDMDVERLRKAAARIERLRAEHRKLVEDRAIAIGALKIIATWASASCFDFGRVERGIGHIHDRAIDALKLMEAMK